jgi:hypothetical protein
MWERNEGGWEGGCRERRGHTVSMYSPFGVFLDMIIT